MGSSVKLPLGTKLEHPCPDCGADMVLRASRYGLFYGCVNYPRCTGAHGAHRESGLPLGLPASRQTKEWRIKAHDAFDVLWRETAMKRTESYLWLQEVMGLTPADAHIGRFSIEQCKKLIEKVEEKCRK